jgi:hypothetical protein
MIKHHTGLSFSHLARGERGGVARIHYISSDTGPFFPLESCMIDDHDNEMRDRGGYGLAPQVVSLMYHLGWLLSAFGTGIQIGSLFVRRGYGFEAVGLAGFLFLCVGLL